MQRAKCVEFDDFLLWIARFCVRSETISLVFTSLRMESADFPSL